MMGLLRSRRVMATLAAVAIFGLVVTMAVGLFTSRDTSQQQVQGEPAPAPEMGALGAEPSRVGYVDLGEECTQLECFRVVGLTSEDLDSEEAIDAVYTTLLDREFGRMLPPGEDDPQEVEWSDSALTDGRVLIQGSEEPPAEGTIAHLVIAHSDPYSA